MMLVRWIRPSSFSNSPLCNRGSCLLRRRGDFLHQVNDSARRFWLSTTVPSRHIHGLTSSIQPFLTFTSSSPYTMPLSRSSDPLVWIDCEMTGLDAETDQILQICCFITDSQLQLLEPNGFEAVVHHPDSTLDTMSPWCIDTHGRTGLTAAVRASTTSASVAADSLLAYIQRHVPTPRTALLAGNSVHADKAFLVREPYAKIMEHLHYRILDVSTIKEAARRWGSEELLRQVPPKREIHLARDDILESIAEMKFYQEKLFA